MDDDFQAAFEAEFSEAPPVEEDTQTHAEAETTEEALTDAEQSTSPESEAVAEEVEEENKQEATEDSEPSLAPQFATKNDVLEAIREDRQAQRSRNDFTADIREKVMAQLHPDGIDKNLYDSENRVINTAQDIVDRGLIDPNTNEPFEYEAAARWMLNAQQSMNQQVENLNAYAEKAAEVYVDLKEGNDRVEELFGDYLKVMPAVAKQLSATYFATLQKDENGIIVKAPLDPVEYYRNALSPYIRLAEQAVNQQVHEKEMAERQAVSARDERMGVPQRGESKAKANTGDQFLDAFIDELGED